MNSEQFRKALDRVGLTQVGAARLFGFNARTVRRWASGEQEIPRVIEVVLWLMGKFRVKPENIPREE